MSAAASRVAVADRVSSRFITSWLVERRYAAHARPIGPRAVKYSALAGKTTGRESISGRYTESTIDRWFEARSAGPLAGMFSSPVARGRPNACRTGPATTRESWYCIPASSVYLGAVADHTSAKALPR